MNKTVESVINKTFRLHFYISKSRILVSFDCFNNHYTYSYKLCLYYNDYLEIMRILLSISI